MRTAARSGCGDYFGKRPVILALVYYECPMLCTQVLNGLVTALGVMNFEPGREFDVVAVSFNPREGPGLASQKKANYLERYGRPHTAAGWHFLTGKEESIKRLTDAIGFRYEFDPEIQQYAHGAGIEVLTPQGRHLEVLLRNRVLGARYQAGADRSLRGSHRHADRRCAAVLLSLRPGDRKVRRRRAAAGARRRGVATRARVPVVSDRDASRRENERPDPSRASGRPSPSRRPSPEPGS